MKLNTEAHVDGIYSQDFKHVVIATGVLPRQLNLKGADRAEVVNYLDVLEGRVDVEKVVIIGAGGIGFDVADYLSHDADNAGFMESWGVDKGFGNRGG